MVRKIANINKKVEKRIVEGIKEAQNLLFLDRMPTSKELRENNFSWLDTLIGKNFGLVYWRQKLKLDSKGKVNSLSEKEVEIEIKRAMRKLSINRMPSHNELIQLEDGERLHRSIIKTYGYREWAHKLKLDSKDSETTLGLNYEEVVIEDLRDRGYKVDVMTTNHPFDILINKAVKIDVKVARPHMLRGESRVHAFSTNKKYGSCDLYLAIALDEADKIEKTLIIPSHRLQIVTLTIGNKSKYDVYNNRHDLIDKYSEFLDLIK